MFYNIGPWSLMFVSKAEPARVKHFSGASL